MKEKDKKVIIPTASGKWIQFISLHIDSRPINKYWLKIWLKSKKQEESRLIAFNPLRIKKDIAEFELIKGTNPVWVDKDITLSVSIICNENDPSEDFELCVLNYKFLVDLTIIACYNIILLLV